MKRSNSRPPIRSAYDKIKGGCDCPDCRPATIPGKFFNWLEEPPGPWSTAGVIGFFVALGLVYYLLPPAIQLAAR